MDPTERGEHTVNQERKKKLQKIYSLISNRYNKRSISWSAKINTVVKLIFLYATEFSDLHRKGEFRENKEDRKEYHAEHTRTNTTKLQHTQNKKKTMKSTNALKKSLKQCKAQTKVLWTFRRMIPSWRDKLIWAVIQLHGV